MLEVKVTATDGKADTLTCEALVGIAINVTKTESATVILGKVTALDLASGLFSLMAEVMATGVFKGLEKRLAKDLSAVILK